MPPPRRRSPWLDDRAKLLIKILAERYNLHLPETGLSDVREDISDQLDHIAKMMRISRRAAKRYVTDEWIASFAERIAAAVQEHESCPKPRPQLRIVD
jgi:hypothetical protein